MAVGMTVALAIVARVRRVRAVASLVRVVQGLAAVPALVALGTRSPASRLPLAWLPLVARPHVLPRPARALLAAALEIGRAHV